MKNTCLKAVAMLGLFLVLGVASVQAQSAGLIEVSIPFDFAAGDMKLKSGDYTVKRISKDAVLFRSADTKTSVMILAPVRISQNRNDAPERLVFNRYGSEYFLSQIWISRTADGRGLAPSRTESRLAKQTPKTNGRQPVEVAARAK